MVGQFDLDVFIIKDSIILESREISVQKIQKAIDYRRMVIG